MQLSIIVPVYNVEKYVRPCIESIFKQGLDEDCFEVIIINDGTQDNSMEVIQDIIEAHQNITVINQENQGLSVARNNGIEKATGEYLMFVDSDDLLIPNSVEHLLEVAIKEKPDLVKADFLKLNNEEIKCFRNHTSSETFVVQERTGYTIFLKEVNPEECFIWRTLYKRIFLKQYHIIFIPDIYFEDIPFTHECFLKANTCIRVHIPLYIYRDRYDSITNTIDKQKCIDFCKVIINLWNLKKGNDLPCQVLNQLDQNIYIFFRLLFFYFVYRIHSVHDREQICDFLHQNLPALSFKHGFFQKICTLWFRHFPHSYAHTRYYYGRIVYKRLRLLFLIIYVFSQYQP